MLICFFLSLSTACQLDQVQDCATKGKSLGLCGQELNCLERQILLDLPSYQISLTGFILKDDAKANFAHLTNCDLQSYSTCFEVHSIEVIDCLSQKFCLEFAEIHNLGQTKQQDQSVTNTQKENSEVKLGSDPGEIGTGLKDENKDNEVKHEELRTGEVDGREEMENVVKELEEIIQKFKASSDNDMVEQLEKITGELDFVQKSLEKEGLDEKVEIEQKTNMQEEPEMKEKVDVNQSSHQINEPNSENPGLKEETRSSDEIKEKLDEHQEKQEVHQSLTAPTHPADPQGMISSTGNSDSSHDSNLMKQLSKPEENLEKPSSEHAENQSTQTNPPPSDLSPSHPSPNLKTETSSADHASQSDPSHLPASSINEPSSSSPTNQQHIDASSPTSNSSTSSPQTTQSHPDPNPDSNQNLHMQETEPKSQSSDTTHQNPQSPADKARAENSANPAQASSQSSNTQFLNTVEAGSRLPEATSETTQPASSTCQEDCESLCSKREDLASCKSECLSNICSKDLSSDYFKLILTSLFLFMVIFVIYLFMQNKTLRSAIENGEYGVAIYSSI